MPIKWNALKVREATDKAESYIEQIKEPLASVKAIAEEALKLPNIPEYIQQGFRSLISEVERTIGGVNSWNNEPHPGNYDRNIQRIRDNIPKDALQSELTSQKYGNTQSLI